MKTRILFLCLALIIGATSLFAQTNGDYRSKATGNWSDASTWETYDGSAWIDATVPPNLTLAITVTISTGHTVTTNTAITANNAGLTIVINGYLKETAVITKTAGNWIVNGTYELNHAPATGQGVPTATWNVGSTCLLTGIASATTGLNAVQNFHHLIVDCPSWSGNLNLGWTSGTFTINGNVTVKNTGSGRWQLGAPTAGNSVTVNINGDLIVDGSATTASALASLTSNGTSNANTTLIINVYGNVTVTGNPANNAWTNFSISRGSQGGSGTSTWNFYGDVSVSDAQIQNSTTTTSGGLGKFVFAKSGTQSLTLSNLNTTSSPINIEVLSGSTLNIGSSTLTPSTGFFTLSSGAGIITSHASGLNGNLTNTGTKTLSTSANYTFNGTSAQVTGALMPATVNNLTINNSAGVTLSGATTVNGTLTLTSGDLALNGKSLTYASATGNGTISETASLNAPSSVNVGNLGAIITSGADLGSTIVKRGFSIQTGGSNQSIARWYDITPTNNSGLNATLVFSYDESELNSISEANLRLFKSTDGGANWTLVGGTVDVDANTVTLTGIDAFSRWTLGDNSNPLPVELTSFTATATRTGAVLAWGTATETNCYGFEIERSAISNQLLAHSQQPTAKSWLKVGFVNGAGTKNSPSEYSYTDANLKPGVYVYRIKQLDNDGAFKYYGSAEVTIGSAPKEFTLSGYPNPFNPVTNIEFTLPENGFATLKVFNIIGQEVATLFSGNVEAGIYNKVSFNASHLSSGMYFSVLEANNQRLVKKLMLTK